MKLPNISKFDRKFKIIKKV